MKKAQSQKKKEVYTKPMLYTHEPLRNITARDSVIRTTVIPFPE